MKGQQGYQPKTHSDNLSQSLILKAQKHIKCCRHPVEEAGPPEPERDEPEQVGEQVIRAAVPAIGRAFDNPAHAVYASKRTSSPTAASNKNAKIPIVTNHIRFMFPSRCLGRGMMAEMS